MMSKQKEAEYRQNQIGIDFTHCPSDQYIRVYIAGEILKGSNFINSQIFIKYTFTLPFGWKGQIPEEIQSMDLSEEQLKEFNCLESITQTVSPLLIKNDNGSFSNQFYFAFPFDLQLLVKQKVAQTQWPTLHFQVFQKDSWDKIYNQGCGFCKIPSSPGFYQIEALTWKPNLDNRSKIFEFFLGGLTHPNQIQSISKSQELTQLDNKGPINRSLFNTVSSGSITTRFNIAIQSKKIKTQERINYKVIKFSQETQQVKSQYSKSQIPGQVSTGNLLGGRFTTTKLNR